MPLRHLRHGLLILVFFGRIRALSVPEGQLHRVMPHQFFEDLQRDSRIEAHLHMLRHACGFALADQGAGHAAHSRLSGVPEHSAHRALHGHQPGTV